MSTPISGLPAALTVGASDVLPIVQGGVTLKTTAQLLVNSQLPIASTVQAGIIQIGVTPGRACDGDDARLSNSRTPSGSAGGDLVGTYPNPTLAALGTAGTYGSTSAIPVLTLDSKGRVASIATSQIIVNASNITSGTLDPNRLETSGVAAGTFGSSAQIPVLTVDSKGRVTVAGSTPVLPGNNASDLTTGTLNPARLETSGVSAGTFGSSATVGQFTVDSKGRITSASNVPISGSAGGTVVAVGATSSTLAISNSPVTYSGALQLELSTTGVPAITAGSSTQSAVITVDAYGRVTGLQTQSIAALFPTGVTAGTYGTSNSVGRFSVNENGVMTGATEQALSIAASQVLSGLTSAQISGLSAAQISGLAASATTDTTNAANISSGLLPVTRLPFSGVVATNYGSATTVPVISVDSYGRITAASNAAVTQLTDASQITSGTLNVNRLATSGVAAGSFGSSTQLAAFTVDQFGRITAASNITTTVSNFGFVRENITVSATAANASVINFDALSQGVLYYTAAATAAWPLNVRGNSGATLNSSMNIGQSVTIVFLNTTGATGYGLLANVNFTIDGTGSTANRTLRWVNGALPAANSNAIDAWSFTIMKTADNVFSVLGSMSTFF